MKEYIIISPKHKHCHAGIQCEYLLCHKLNERGIIAYITGSTEESKKIFNIKVAEDLSIEKLKELQHKGIILYPDIIPNNPYKFTNVAKWWLGKSVLSFINQINFNHSSIQNVINKPKAKLGIFYIENFFTLPEEENRIYNTYYFGKFFVNENLIKDEKNNIIITLDFPKTRKELSDILKKSKVLYCFDNFTMMIEEARLCGCPVILFENSSFSKEDYINRSRFKLNGIGFYNEQNNIENLRKQIPEFIAEYKEILKLAEKELDTFIEETQKWNPDQVYVDDPGIYNPNLFLNSKFNVWKIR